MGRVGKGPILRIAAFAFGLALTGLAFNGRADDAKPDVKKPAAGADALKDELLTFNRATGEDAQRLKLIAFVKDKEKAKMGVALALKLQKDAKPKDRPFNFGASMIVARAAHFVKDYDTSEYFYTQCAEAATKLESGEKIRQAYDGLIKLYWGAKRYEDVVDTCEKFVELKGPAEVDGYKPFVLERLIQAKAKQGKTDEALRITEGLIQTLSEADWYFLQTKAWVQREAGKFDDSIETYLEALDKIEATKRLMA